jgi:hypothetical protein
MFSNVFRDAELVEALQPTLLPFQAFMADATEVMAAGWPARGRRRAMLAAALNHALDFRTWHSLAAAGRLTRTEAAELVTALVAKAAGQRQRTVA